MKGASPKPLDLIGEVTEKTQIESEKRTMNEKPINQANVERRVAEYDCRGHWWGMTPGFVSLTLIGAVAGLVRRTIVK